MVTQAVIEMKKKIAAHGFAIMNIFGKENEPCFSYTVGLSKTYNHPELICFGLPFQTMNILFHTIVSELIEKKEQLKPLIPYDDFSNMPMEFVRVESYNIEKYMCGVRDYYADAHTIEAMQMLWPDPQGCFPYEKGYDKHYILAQPILAKI